jgi:hypothetical protein
VSPPRRLDRGAMRLALQWAHGISEPLRVDPAKRSVGGSGWLDRRGKEGENPRRSYRGNLRPARFPTVHATDSRNRRSLGLALTAVGKANQLANSDRLPLRHRRGQPDPHQVAHLRSSWWWRPTRREPRGAVEARGRGFSREAVSRGTDPLVGTVPESRSWKAGAQPESLDRGYRHPRALRGHRAAGLRAT